MASSFSLSNFISFISPPKSHPKTPPQNLSASSSSYSTRRSQEQRNSVISIATDDSLSSSSLSSSSSIDLASVICPSLAYSNTLFFKSAYNVQVVVEEKEPEERLLNRFRREVMRAGVIQECKRRRFFENKQDEKKRSVPARWTAAA